MSIGISEETFWNSTIAELERKVSAINKMEKRRAQEKAIADYKLADLIGASVARLFSNSQQMPTLQEAYPTLFDSVEQEETIAKNQDKVSVLRLKQFAKSFNARFKNKEEQINE